MILFSIVFIVFFYLSINIFSSLFKLFLLQVLLHLSNKKLNSFTVDLNFLTGLLQKL